MPVRVVSVCELRPWIQRVPCPTGWVTLGPLQHQLGVNMNVVLAVRCPSNLGYGQEGRVDQKHHHGRVLGPLELAAVT